MDLLIPPTILYPTKESELYPLVGCWAVSVFLGKPFAWLFSLRCKLVSGHLWHSKPFYCAETPWSLKSVRSNSILRQKRHLQSKSLGETADLSCMFLSGLLLFPFPAQKMLTKLKCESTPTALRCMWRTFSKIDAMTQHPAAPWASHCPNINLLVEYKEKQFEMKHNIAVWQQKEVVPALMSGTKALPVNLRRNRIHFTQYFFSTV